MNVKPLSIDLDAANRFLEALCQRSGGLDVPHMWQTFDDQRSRGQKNLVRVHKGNLQDRIADFEALQSKGAGVFITVNETTLKGRKASDIRAIRSLWVDLDLKDAITEPDFQSLPLPPTIITKSGHGWHLYWVLAEPSWDLDRARMLLKSIAHHLKDWGADDSATDVARVLRLPGSWNLKDPGNPVAVELTQCDLRLVYDMEDLEMVFPASESRKTMLPPMTKHVWADQLSGDDKVSQARRYLRAYPPAISGEGGNHRTYRAACLVVVDYDLGDQDALSVLSEWNQGCVPPWTEQDLVGFIERARKYHTGVPGLKLRDPKVPQGNQRVQPVGDLFPGESVPVDDPDEGVSVSQLAQMQQDELALGERFVARYGDRSKWTPAWDSWMVWTGQVWQIDSGPAERMADQVLRGLMAEAATINDMDKRNAFLQFVRNSQRYNKRKAVLGLAQSYLGINANQLDADPMLLNCQNGVLDLRTGEVFRHQDCRDQLHTKIAGTLYDPKAPPTFWEDFLASVIVDDNGNPDTEVIGYLQRVFGYCLTGDVSEQMWSFYSGGGSNGKSTLVETVQKVIGDYSGLVPDSMLVGDGSKVHTTDKLKLKGIRFAVAQEVRAGSRWNEAMLKHLTGGDRVSARALYSNIHQEWDPTHKLFVCANHRPEVADSTHSFWRRLHLVPFKRMFFGPNDRGYDRVDPKLRKDPQLPMKLRAELPGIMAWMVRGCLDWQRRREVDPTDGLGYPRHINEKVNEYRADQDHLGNFIEARCVVSKDPGIRVRSSDLKDAFQEWAESNGVPGLSAGDIKAGITDRLDWFKAVFGVEPVFKRDGQGSGWRYLGLNPNQGTAKG